MGIWGLGSFDAQRAPKSSKFHLVPRWGFLAKLTPTDTFFKIGSLRMACGVLGGGPWELPGESLGVPGESLGGSLGVPGGSLGVPGGSLEGPWGVPGGVPWGPWGPRWLQDWSHGPTGDQLGANLHQLGSDFDQLGDNLEPT